MWGSCPWIISTQATPSSSALWANIGPGTTSPIAYIPSIFVLNCLFSIIIFSYFEENSKNLELLLLISATVSIFLLANFGLVLPKIFLGDSGSTSLGFLISCLLVYYTLPENRYFHPTTWSKIELWKNILVVIWGTNSYSCDLIYWC